MAFRRKDVERMAKASTTIEINVTGFDCVKEALAQRDQKIEELQNLIRENVCGKCVLVNTRPAYCFTCWAHEGLQL